MSDVQNRGRVPTQQLVVALADGRELDLVVGNPDMVRWDLTAAKHGWPAMDKAPMLWATFVAWRAAVRTGVYDGTWEKWSDTDAVGVHVIGGDEDDQAGVDPTQRAAGDG